MVNTFDNFPRIRFWLGWTVVVVLYEETVYIFGSEAKIFLLSQRTSATSFALIYPLMYSFPRYMEFQHKAWREVMANRPKYIITIAPKSSLLWDGKADLWIMRQTKRLIEADYSLVAAVTGAEPKGRSILLHEKDALLTNEQNYLARVYKRKLLSTQN